MFMGVELEYVARWKKKLLAFGAWRHAAALDPKVLNVLLANRNDESDMVKVKD